MNRKTALDIIRAEYAKHGEMTRAAMRAYAESHISYGAFAEAKKSGIRAYQEGHEQWQ